MTSRSSNLPTYLLIWGDWSARYFLKDSRVSRIVKGDSSIMVIDNFQLQVADNFNYQHNTEYKNIDTGNTYLLSQHLHTDAKKAGYHDGIKISFH